LLLRQPGTPPTEAEACFQQALDVARHQQAKSLELRAAMSLARLWQQQGKRAEAHELLAPVGFDHGVGHPLLLLYDAKAPHGRKNKAFKSLGHYAESPKVADAVIKAPRSTAGSPRALIPRTCKRRRHCWTRWRNATPVDMPWLLANTGYACP
jgi:hypothetical protein